MEQNVFICMMPKPYSSMKYKKFHGINAQKLSCVDKKNIYIYIFIYLKKSMKNESQMKSFQSM